MDKMIEFESKSIQIKLDEAGKVTASIASFGVVDKDGDIVESTAFSEGQEVAMVWSHDWSRPVGKGIIHVSSTEALFEGSFFMDTTDGMEAYKTVKAMDNLQEWSWGFHVTKRMVEETDTGYIRHIQETEVYEFSPVLKGAGIRTGTRAIKGRQTLDAEIAATVEVVDSLGERVRSLKGLRQEEGRTISEDRLNEVRGLATSLRDAADELEKSIVVEAPKAEVVKEYAKFQAFIARQNGVGKGN